MANDNKEIEIQVKIEKDVFDSLKCFLGANANFIKTIYQEDDYYTPAHKNFLEPEHPYEWLRVGKRGDRVVITYKNYHPKNFKEHVYCDEYETEVKSKEQIDKIFSALSFKKLITVKKTREVYEYNDEFEVALDTVEELGYNIEIELIKDFGSIEAGLEVLYKFAKDLGINPDKRESSGYPMRLLIEKGMVKQA